MRAGNPGFGVDAEAAAVGKRGAGGLHPGHAHGALDGDGVAVLVGGEVIDDVRRGRETLVRGHGDAREVGELGGGKQRHRRPHLPPGTARRFPGVQHEHVDAGAKQVKRGGQARLPTADDDDAVRAGARPFPGFAR